MIYLRFSSRVWPQGQGQGRDQGLKVCAQEHTRTEANDNIFSFGTVERLKLRSVKIFPVFYKRDIILSRRIGVMIAYNHHQSQDYSQLLSHAYMPTYRCLRGREERLKMSAKNCCTKYYGLQY